MGKRKNQDKKHLMKKIRKLERKLEKIPEEINSGDSSPSTSPMPPESQCLPVPLSPVPQNPQTPTVQLQPPSNDLDQDVTSGLWNTRNNVPILLKLIFKRLGNSINVSINDT